MRSDRALKAKTPPYTEKHAKEQITLLSVPDQDGRFTSLGPRAPKAAHCSWGPGGRTVRGGKMLKSNSRGRRPACVCVCPVSPPNICKCVLLCVLTAPKYMIESNERM